MPKANAQTETWIALLGRLDSPTDGVEDYCTFLGKALARRGVELEKVRVEWMGKGWAAALSQLWRKSDGWYGKWVLVQYTALGWSRRGFPFGLVVVLAVLRRRGARPAIVFHEPFGSSGPRWIDRMRGACQQWVIQNLHRCAETNIFTVPVESVDWLPTEDTRAAFIPIGPNIPECLDHRAEPKLADQMKTILVFGVTGAPETEREVDDIAATVRKASETILKVRLVVVGRGSLEAREQLAKALEGCPVELIVRGILPAEELTREFERGDVLLCVRGTVTPRRGSAIAGIACGLPIVGYRKGMVSSPMDEAGVEWSSWRDREGLAQGLVKVLSDPQHWMELHERNLRLQRTHFSWAKISEQVIGALQE